MFGTQRCILELGGRSEEGAEGLSRSAYNDGDGVEGFGYSSIDDDGETAHLEGVGGTGDCGLNWEWGGTDSLLRSVVVCDGGSIDVVGTGGSVLVVSCREVSLTVVSVVGGSSDV